jgi:hypothetical protein
MGEVYRATDSVLERPVAVKLLAEHYAREDESRARFQREALAAARLSREANVVTVFDVGEHYGRPLIVMEYMDGGSVHDRLADGPVSHEQALEWLEQIARALDRAHAKGIVHRDVKPANLLLDSEGHLRVSDFGIASAAGLETVTLPGTVLGTAGYISPEQARGEPAIPASDRYALGVIAFELLTGRRPFAGDTAATEAFAHVNAPVPSAERLDPGIPRGVDDVLARALAKDPADRPASCAELVADLSMAFETADGRAPVELAGVATRVDAPAPILRREEPTTRVLVRRLPPGPSRAGRFGAALVAGLRSLGSSARRVAARPARGPQSAVAVSALAILAGGIAGFALLGFGDGGPNTADRPSRAPAESPQEEEAAEAPTEPAVDGVALNNQGFELMEDERYAEALPLFRDAVAALLGSKTFDEAFASYNLAFTRFALGSCDGVIGLLDRSERIQGQREEIDRLREEWNNKCGVGGDVDDAEADEDDGKPGKGKGRGNGRGRGDD